VPREEQCHRQTGDLVVVDAVGRAERGDDVVVGVGALAGDEIQAVVEQGGQSTLGTDPIADVGDVLGPAPKARPICVGHAEQLADHEDREG
jgi:hypothetical protein